MSTFATNIARGLRSAEPAAASVSVGSLYYVTDEGKIERNNGSSWDSFGATKVIQTVNTETGAVATGTTIIPWDDTIPQITEGDEYMTLAITPTSATNKLRIEVVVFATCLNTPWIIAALFQDATANALAAGVTFPATSTAGSMIAFQHYMTAGTTSATTFRVRIGPHSASTITFNGQSSGRKLGGVMASSITITEIFA